MKAPTDQLQASLAGEDDGGSVVLCRVGRTLGGAVVGDGHLALGAADLRAAGRPPDILSETEREN